MGEGGGGHPPGGKRRRVGVVEVFVIYTDPETFVWPTNARI